MPDRFWAFAEACDETHSLRAARDLLGANLRALGFERFLLTTHGGQEDLRSLSVLAHNWPQEALSHLSDGCDGCNPLFPVIEQTRGDIVWQSTTWRSALPARDLEWLKQLRAYVGGNGVSRAMRCALVHASCSLVSEGALPKDKIDLAMRVANYAYHHIQYVQRPSLGKADLLTAREQECLYRAAVRGERPSTVARKLGVKVSTVRTLRQKANARLDADSPEQAVWHMIETGQLFRKGRTSKPRTS
ncbi:MAG: hypothetical protein EON93_01865 [Burkholderiales bacterium]|nr:MAG: hypothetical protein EON93_01865 [Burkholderiales bacterium]